jgi:hypothetical protein
LADGSGGRRIFPRREWTKYCRKSVILKPVAGVRRL